MNQFSSIPPMTLPKSAALTDVLFGQIDRHVEAPLCADLRDELQHALHRRAEIKRLPSAIRVDGYVLRRPISGEGNTDRESFRWSPRTARRPLGLHAVRLWLRGTHRTPSDAVAQVMHDAVVPAEDGRAHPRSLSNWLVALSAGGRSVVQAEVVNWSTHLIAALDWGHVKGAPLTVGHDEWWTDSDRVVALRGRAELHVGCGDGPSGGSLASTLAASALFTMLPGMPSRAAPLELGLIALVAALGGRPTSVPGRVVGWWPHCGRAVVVDVDESLLRSTLERVISTVDHRLGTRPSQLSPAVQTR